MSSWIAQAAFVLVAGLGAAPYATQESSRSEVAANAKPPFSSATFEFNRSGVAVSHWTIEVHADDSGTYTAAPGSSQPIQVGSGTREKLAAAYPTVRADRCETRMKHIADTGRKMLSYQAGEARVSCTFNFSDSQPLNTVTDAFLAIAETMQAGERLAQKHRYDRLGLDAEIEALEREVKDGQASEVGNIAPTLKAIVDDERVMERVRIKAARLLQDAGGSDPSDSSAR